MSTKRPPDTTEESTSARLDAAMLAAIAEIEGQLDIVEQRRAELVPGGFDKDLSNAAASLSRALAALNAEHRAGIKARTFTARNLPPELVMEHLRLLQPEQRAHIIRELQRLDDTESVLG